MREGLEVTVRERAAMMGTKDFLGVPLEVWDLVSDYNKQHMASARDCINVGAAPLLKAVYELGQKAAS